MAAAISVAAVLAMIWPLPEIPPVEPTPRPSLVSEPAKSVRAPEMAAAAPVRLLRTGPANAPVAAVPDDVIAIDLPEVVIAENEVQAYQGLLALTRQRRFDAAVPAARDLDAPLEIEAMPPVEPLEIEPIVKLAARQSEGERP
jgi:hypothetical protein